MWPVSEFEVTLWADGPGPARHFLTRDPAEVLAAVGPGSLLLEVDAGLRRPAGSADVSLGYFWLWLEGGGMARVRLDEHREHFARDPARAGLLGEVGGLPDGDGGAFAVPAADAVTAEQAGRALACWLDGGVWWPGLVWD